MAFKAMQVQMQVRENSTELNDFLKDLNRWEDKIKHEDRNLKTSRRLEEKLPPVRQKVKKDKKIIETNNNHEKAKRIKSYDYDAWAKYDVDEACKEVNNKDTSSEEDVDDEENEEEAERIQEERKLQQAVMEKEKGNQLFKEGKYEAAINRYTSAILLHSTNSILYANRGMALIKTEKFGAAIEDCNIALELDPSYSKAIARRATARCKLKKYEEALKDYQTLLTLDPSNKQAATEIERIQKLLLEKKVETEQQKEEKKVDLPKEPKKNETRRRSNKPLKRIHIEEVGLEDEEDDDVIKKNERVPNIENPVSITDSISFQLPNKDTQQAYIDKLLPSTQKTVDVPVIPSQLVVPTASFMFETELKRLKNDEESLYSYIKIIPTDMYSKLFHQCIDVIISPFLSILSNCFIRDQVPFDDHLNCLSQFKRFDMAVLFLSKKDKETLMELFEHLKSKDYNKILDENYLKSLSNKYKLN